jgi:acetylornithine deacetylase/succinyl-diaminopimelate desuccinylase-like protein
VDVILRALSLLFRPTPGARTAACVHRLRQEHCSRCPARFGAQACRPNETCEVNGMFSSKLKNCTASAWCAGLLALGLAAAAPAGNTHEIKTDPAADALAHDIFQELIGINTTDSVGSVTQAAQAMAQRLRSAGFAEQDLQLVGPNPRKQNLVARLHGSGAHRPVLLIGHLDVVEAPHLEWSTDPFQLVEQDGYFYGRGVSDMKDGDAILVATLMRLKREGYKPDRDVILALTAGEESGLDNGVDWLLKNRRNLIDAEWVINEDDQSVLMRSDAPQYYKLGATEKIYADFLLSTANPGGHSSLPRPDNAIYQLTAALDRLQHHQFPFELNAVTRAYFERMFTLESGPHASDMRAILKSPADPAAIERLSQDALYNALLRTTCVPTRLNAGQANNALPQVATANVNCRILPGHSPEEVRQELIKVVADQSVRLQYEDPDGSVLDRAPDDKGLAPTPLDAHYLRPLESLVERTWPGIPVIPMMDNGASDGTFTRAAGMPTYNITGIAINRDDIRDHARNERLEVSSFYHGNEFFYHYLKSVTGTR